MRFEQLIQLAPVAVAIVGITIGGWVITTWLRIKHGYPLDGAWGQALLPHTDKEALARIKLLTNENAELRAEIGSMKDRLETTSRIGWRGKSTHWRSTREGMRNGSW